MKSQFNTESAREAGKKSKRGKALILNIDTTDGSQLIENSLAGVYGIVVQKQVLLLVVQHQLKATDRATKRTLDEEASISSAYLKHLNRHEIESLIEREHD